MWLGLENAPSNGELRLELSSLLTGASLVISTSSIRLHVRHTWNLDKSHVQPAYWAQTRAGLEHINLDTRIHLSNETHGSHIRLDPTCKRLHPTDDSGTYFSARTFVQELGTTQAHFSTALPHPTHRPSLFFACATYTWSAYCSAGQISRTSTPWKRETIVRWPGCESQYG